MTTATAANVSIRRRANVPVHRYKHSFNTNAPFKHDKTNNAWVLIYCHDQRCTNARTCGLCKCLKRSPSVFFPGQASRLRGSI